MKDCTFSPSISKSKYEVSPDRRKIKELANLEFKKKGVWLKKWNLSEDSPTKPRISIVIFFLSIFFYLEISKPKNDFYDPEKKDMIIEKIMTTPKKNKRYASISGEKRKLFSQSKTSLRCEFCKQIHSHLFLNKKLFF